MAELADAPDLGSGVHDVQVQVLLSAFIRGCCKTRILVNFATFPLLFFDTDYFFDMGRIQFLMKRMLPCHRSNRMLEYFQPLF